MGLRERIGAALGSDAAAMIGVGLTALWLVMVAGFWLLGPDAQGSASGLMRLASIMAVLLPVALIWVAVGLAAAIAALRAEAADLRLRLGQMRDTVPQPRPGPGLPPAQPARAEARPATRSAPEPARPASPVARAAGQDGRQTAMRFDAPEPVNVDAADLIRALNFPEGPDDVETIAALRAALRDHDTSRVIRSAQDVITLMAENGLYMDHLQPPEPDPALWRRFAEGMRGPQMQRIAAIEGDGALDLTLAMLKGDEIFRDSAHHFLRHFDLLLTRIGGELDDRQLQQLADTRSARAFMLLGRAANVFG